MNKQPKITSILLYMLILGALLYLFTSLFTPKNSSELSYSQVVSLFEEEQVKSFVVKDDVLTMEVRKPVDGETKLSYTLGSFSVFYNDLNDLVIRQAKDGVIESYDYPPDTKTPLIVSMLPYILLGVVFLLLMFFLLNRANGGQGAMKFGKANARVAGTGSKERVTFADVAGAEEEKAELAEIVDFLRDPTKYNEMGARIPKGVLLVGPPGTGKTLIARAVAGEAQVQFLSISGSDFVELYVGVGASRVRDLFEQAKKMAPSIIFIDEIDAVGRRRGAGLGGGHDEREQTLNQLLVEMDGFTKNEGVIVMAATNRKDILDPALLRPGRFDRQVYVDTPDVRGREAILKVHARSKPLSEDVDLAVIAKATSGFTGADLSNLLNEAALLAARKNQPFITMHDAEEAMMKVIAGPEKKSRVISQHERRLTAIHEAGHAVAAFHLPTHDPVQQITIIPRGNAGGMTVYLPEDDTRCPSYREMYEFIVSCLGGRVAERLYMEDISTGASNDLERATSIARDMVAKYGMSERLGAVVYDSNGEIFVGRDYEKTKSYSERVAGDIDDEVKRIIDTAYDHCTKLLTENREKLLQIADYLLENEHMSRDQFEACMENREIPAGDGESLFAHFQPAGDSSAPDSPAQETGNVPEVPSDTDHPTPPQTP